MLSRVINRIKLFFPSNPKKVFRRIYKRNDWGSTESVSGPGSTLAVTKELRKQLPEIFEKWNIRSMLDAPCGDFNWMSHVDLDRIDYTGADIVPEIISANQEKYPEKKFLQLDLIYDPLPAADLVFCRDCFIHLRNNDINRAILNFKQRGIKFLMASTYPVEFNAQILTGHFRPVNLLKAPFSLSKPLELIPDYAQDGSEKYLGLWLLSEP